MRYRDLVFAGVVAVVVAAASVPLLGQSQTLAAPPKAMANPPRTPWGDVDLRGNWGGGGSGMPLERPSRFEGREFKTEAEMAGEEKRLRERDAKRLDGTATEFGFRQQPNFPAVFQGTPTLAEGFRVSRRTSAIIDPPDGRLPAWTPQQIKQYEAREAAKGELGETYAPEERSLSERCFGSFGPGPVPSWGLGAYARHDLLTSTGSSAAAAFVAGLEQTAERTDVGQVTGGEGGAGGVGLIMQTPGWIVIGSQIIPLDSRPKLGSEIQQWEGSSRARWEGTTLVVETTNVRANAPVIPTYDVSLYPGSGETLKVTQRYTLVDADTMDYRYTIEDAEVYVRPYTVLAEPLRRGKRIPTREPRQCHEKNNMTNVLANARADEAANVEYADESKTIRQETLAALKAAWAKQAQGR